MLNRICAAILVAALTPVAGCGGVYHPRATADPVPPSVVHAPPESARTPDGARPEPPPKAVGLAPGEKTIDATGLHLIESFEGYSRCAYFDRFGGVWTAGYGQTHGVFHGFCFASQLAAQNNLASSVRREYEWAVHALGPRVSRNQNAVNGLDSFAYNLGAGIFTGRLRERLVAGNFGSACQIMESYDHAGGVVLEGLRTRRLRECALIKRQPPKPALTKDLLARRRTLRRVLLTHGCDHRRAHRQKLGPTCTRWFQEGASVNRQLHARGVR